MPEAVLDGVIAMQACIVATDDRPCGIALDKRDACSVYDRIFGSGRHRLAVMASEDRWQALFEFYS